MYNSRNYPPLRPAPVHVHTYFLAACLAVFSLKTGLCRRCARAPPRDGRPVGGPPARAPAVRAVSLLRSSGSGPPVAAACWRSAQRLAKEGAGGSLVAPTPTGGRALEREISAQGKEKADPPPRPQPAPEIGALGRAGGPGWVSVLFSNDSDYTKTASDVSFITAPQGPTDTASTSLQDPAL